MIFVFCVQFFKCFSIFLTSLFFFEIIYLRRFEAYKNKRKNLKMKLKVHVGWWSLVCWLYFVCCCFFFKYYFGWISVVHRSRSQVTLNCLAKSETEIEMLLYVAAVLFAGRLMCEYVCIYYTYTCAVHVHETPNAHIKFTVWLCAVVWKKERNMRRENRRAPMMMTTKKKIKKNKRVQNAKKINIQNQQQQQQQIMCMYILEWKRRTTNDDDDDDYKIHTVSTMKRNDDVTTKKRSNRTERKIYTQERYTLKQRWITNVL